jgi:hypothetical protein
VVDPQTSETEWSAPVPLRHRAAIALLVGVATSAWVHWGSVRNPAYRSDFDQLLFGARAILHRVDPYGVIGPGRAFDQPWPFYYSPAATFVALPFSGLSTVDARTGYAFCIAACVTFLLLRGGYGKLPGVMSGAYLQAMSLLQWSPLMTCALLAPAWGWVVAAKPNAGLLVLAGRGDRRSAVPYLTGAAVALGLSFLLVPAWPAEWWAAIRAAPHVQPYALRPGGALLLLAAMRWRRAEARYLLALSLVPTSTGAADTLLLFAFPHTFRQGLCLALLTHAAYFYGALQPPAADMTTAVRVGASATLVFVLLPALVVILRRPNIGPSLSQSRREPDTRADQRGPPE